MSNQFEEKINSQIQRKSFRLFDCNPYKMNNCMIMI